MGGRGWLTLTRSVKRSAAPVSPEGCSRLIWPRGWGVGRMTISRLERGGPVSMGTAVRALAECGAALAVVPKFARIEVTPNDQQ